MIKAIKVCLLFCFTIATVSLLIWNPSGNATSSGSSTTEESIIELVDDFTASLELSEEDFCEKASMIVKHAILIGENKGQVYEEFINLTHTLKCPFLGPEV